jgi:hypothetical protein
MRRDFMLLMAAALAMPAGAQWLGYPTPNIPRLPDGKVNLDAPAPKTADGHPDIYGLWMPQGLYIGDITKGIKPADLPIQPWAAELYKHRRDTESKEDPTGWCVPGGVPRSDAVPYPFKIVPVPAAGMVLVLYEAVHSYRQIFTDGRRLPDEPNPTWMGYSIGHWDGDTFVVETSGFNNTGWLDNYGHPATDALKVTERFHRKDFGHLDIQVTIDDPKAYTKPWTVTLPNHFLADNELLEYVCVENNKDLQHLVGK